ncbi:hypothetical protein HMI54_009158 [Coelomomyces lativittatus]|nr:hypothetical protein HMI54_009158 [Coelomomyces lativittatus]
MSDIQELENSMDEMMEVKTEEEVHKLTSEEKEEIYKFYSEGDEEMISEIDESEGSWGTMSRKS